MAVAAAGTRKDSRGVLAEKSFVGCFPTNIHYNS